MFLYMFRAQLIIKQEFMHSVGQILRRDIVVRFSKPASALPLLQSVEIRSTARVRVMKMITHLILVLRLMK